MVLVVVPYVLIYEDHLLSGGMMSSTHGTPPIQFNVQKKAYKLYVIGYLWFNKLFYMTV